MTLDPPLALGTARELLHRYGIAPRKSLGQNFLVDPRVPERIAEAAGIGPGDGVIEIGPGLGALTVHLLARAGQVVAIERDETLASILESELRSAPNLRVIQADALDCDFAKFAQEMGRPLRVVGNLPYVITSPLLFKVIEAAHLGAVSLGLFMVQKEFAERVVAKPGNKVYGRLSVMVQYAAEVELVFHVGRGAFFPVPAVTSSVVRLRPRAMPKVDAGDRVLFERVVRDGFGGRRKMLRRSLEPSFGKEALDSAFRAAGIEGTQRAEELSVEKFAALTRHLSAHHA